MTHSENTAFECSACHFSCDSDNKLKTHIILTHEIKRETNEDLISRSESIDLDCSSSEHSNDNSSNSGIIKDTNRGLKSCSKDYINIDFLCSVCYFICDSNDKLKVHLASEHNDDITVLNCSVDDQSYSDASYLCPNCNYKCDSDAELKMHMRVKHSDDGVANSTCFKNNFKSTTIKDLISRTVSYYYTRSKRGKHNFTSKLNAHMASERTNDDTALLICSKCDFACGTTKDFQLHLDRHRTNDFPCLSCHFKCSSDDELKAHKVSEHDNLTDVLESFQCRIDAGIEADSLNQIHENDASNYFCFDCNVRCKSFKELRSHLDKHTVKIDKFNCCICQFKSDSYERLKMHLASHLSDELNIEATENDGVSKRRETVLSTDDLRCSKCRFTCKLEDSLRKHHLLHAVGYVFNDLYVRLYK